MDFLKIPIWLWLFLVKSTPTVSTSTCESGKYFVPSNNEINIENCFCFKKPGEHRTVPQILNQNNDNLERLVVYLYKDKITNLVKLYIPNEEKQSLVPDLAFEVGDNLNTLGDDKKVKDIFNVYIHSAPAYNNIPIAHGQAKQPEYTDGNNVLPTEITKPDPIVNVDHHSNENLHVKPVKIPTIEINEPHEEIYYYDPSHKQLHSDDPNIISKEVNKPDIVTYEYINDNYYDPNIDKVISKDINIPNKKVYVNIHEPREDLISFPREEVNIPAIIKPVDDVNYSEPSIIKEVPSKKLNIPTATIDSNGYDFHEKFDKPPYYVDINRIPTKEDQPDKGMHVDDISNIKPVVDINYQRLPELSHYPMNQTPKQINIPTEEMYINNIDPQSLISVDNQPGGNSWNILEIHTNRDVHNPSEGHRYIHADPSNNPENTIQYPIHDSGYQPREETKHIKENDSGSGHIINTFVVENISNQKVDPSIQKDIRENNEGYEVNSNVKRKSGKSQSDNNKWDAYKQLFEEINFSNKVYNIAVQKGSKEDQETLPLHSDNEYETFDRWFIQQMQRFKTYTEHDRAINLLTIERSILKILQDNDMHVTDEGVLTDSYGTAIDVHNLHLRPILIGNPMDIGSLLNEKAKDLVMPANMAYLQAILVTNSNPSMILGIIPIGKTVIPSSAINAFSTLLKPHTYNSWNPKSTHHGTHSSTVTPNDDRNINIEYIHEKKPIVLHLTTKTKPVMLGPNKTKTLLTVVKETPVIVSQYQQHRQPVETFQAYSDTIHEKNDLVITAESAAAVNKLINSIKDGNDRIKSAEATNSLLVSLRSGKDNLTVATEKSKEVEVEEIEEEDISGRIVGGSAATSSGAPLSVKGRIKDLNK